jgi:ribonuclease HII
MAKAIAGLKKVDYAIFDGNFVPPNVDCESDYLVKGDEKVTCISAASILAKVTRDRLMLEQAKLYPEYGFEKHKYYLTKFPFGLSISIRIYKLPPFIMNPIK